MESFNSLLQLARSLMRSSTSMCDTPKPVLSRIGGLCIVSPQIGNLTFLKRIDLSNNSFHGEIPQELGKLFRLQYLMLLNNSFQGSIPNSIGKLSMLEILVLEKNNISREIPSSIRNLSRLGGLYLSANLIEGSIPISLGNYTNVQQIFLDYNHLTGAIPYQIFGLPSLFNLALSQNYLTGLLPQEVGNFENLGGLYLSKNKLFGEIPATLGNCEVLEFLYIDGNLFEGTIPTVFRQLKGIQELDVFRNNLSGQIPRFLREFRFFQYLNLSYNMIDGEVLNGGVFTNISAFSVVGNSNLCRGIKLLQLPTCTMQVLNERKRPFNHRVLKLHERGANKSFVTKCEALKNIRHRNLVKIITACSNIDFKGNDFKALVFEFMENGSLENWLHPSLLEQHESKNLNFVQRLNIAIDVACALDYLHNHCEMDFVHCDLKPGSTRRKSSVNSGILIAIPGIRYAFRMVESY
ncbi:hypothetical protein ACSBR2_040641 [Camellia fascicularis]